MVQILKTTAVAGMALYGLFLTGCGATDTNKEQTKQEQTTFSEGKEDVQQEFNDEISQFRTDVAKTTEDNKEALEKLKMQAKAEKQEVRESYKKKVAELEEKNKQLQARLDDYDEKSNEKWQTFKAEFKHDMKELGTAIRDLGRKNVDKQP